ncbi:hypothetical protein ZWY2020_019535 [Hordeum vulgare]|nr:hypothetical protein ZWY2020_019535 [Hordeum vulgare]
MHGGEPVVDDAVAGELQAYGSNGEDRRGDGEEEQLAQLPPVGPQVVVCRADVEQYAGGHRGDADEEVARSGVRSRRPTRNVATRRQRTTGAIALTMPMASCSTTTATTIYACLERGAGIGKKRRGVAGCLLCNSHEEAEQTRGRVC